MHFWEDRKVEWGKRERRRSCSRTALWDGACAHIHPKAQRADCLLCFPRVIKENKFPPSCLHRLAKYRKGGNRGGGQLFWLVPPHSYKQQWQSWGNRILSGSFNRPYKNTPEHQILIVLGLISQMHHWKWKKGLCSSLIFLFPLSNFWTWDIFLLPYIVNYDWQHHVGTWRKLI